MLNGSLALSFALTDVRAHSYLNQQTHSEGGRYRVIYCRGFVQMKVHYLVCGQIAHASHVPERSPDGRER